MTLGGLTYLLFTLLAWLLVQVMPTARARQVILLVASYLFYASWGLDFLAVLLVSTALNFALGRALHRRPTATLLWSGVAVNLLLLATFKYLPSLASPSLPSIVRQLVMPVGISFWTFQALSTLFDIYRDEDLAPDPLEFALFLSFWPTVLSGPVTRFPDFQEQVHDLGRAGWDDVAEGSNDLLTGLFLKTVLAQLLAAGVRTGEGVDSAFAQIAQGWGVIDVWTLAIGYGFQLFFDFAGYSLLVIGVARLFGITLPQNFDSPYRSTTPALFWTRWHMSLSSWIRDYVFLPLATRSRVVAWHYTATFLAMVLFGLWHGATWGFVLWGAYQGVLLVAHRLIQRVLKPRPLPAKLNAALGWVLTFGSICLGWLLFRARDVHQALAMIRAGLSPAGIRTHVLPMNLVGLVGIVAVGYFATLAGAGWLERHPLSPAARRLLSRAAPLYYAGLVLAVIVWSKQKSVFVYFQF